MCRICQHLEKSKKQIKEKVNILQRREKELISYFQQELDSLVGILLLLNLTKNIILPPELLLIIKEFTKEDIKEIARELDKARSYIKVYSKVLGNLEDFLPSICPSTTGYTEK